MDDPTAITKEQEPTPTELVELCLLLGRMLFQFGASTRRILDSVEQLVARLGVARVHMLVSYDALSVTVSDGPSFRTKIDESKDVAGLNIIGMLAISKLLHDLDRKSLGYQEVKRRLGVIRAMGTAWIGWMQALACGAVSAAYSLLNGGDPIAWIGSFIGGVVIYGVKCKLLRMPVSFVQKVFMMSLAGTFVAALYALIFPTTTAAITTLAPVLFLVAGVPLINGGMDVVSNHVPIGISRMFFSFAVLVAIVLGIAGPFYMLGDRSAVIAVYQAHGLWEYILPACAGAVAAASLVVIFNGSWGIFILCASGGLLARLCRALVMAQGVDIISATLVAAVTSTVFILLVSRQLKISTVSLSVICILPMIPGYFAIEGLRGLFEFTISVHPSPEGLVAATHNLLTAIYIVLSLVLGVIAPAAILQNKMPKY